MRVIVVFVAAIQFTYAEAFTSKESWALCPGSSRWRHQVGAPGAQSARWRHISVTSHRRLSTCRRWRCGRMSRLRVRGGLPRRRRLVDGVPWRETERGGRGGGRRRPSTATAPTTDDTSAVLRRWLSVRSASVHVAPEVHRRQAAFSDSAASSTAARRGSRPAVVLQWRVVRLSRRSSPGRRKVGDNYDICQQRPNATGAGSGWRTSQRLVDRCRCLRDSWRHW